MPIPPFLATHLLPALDAAHADPSGSFPHITLTWAQSLDAKIAGPGGARVMISGPESMRMTHWLRATHEAILVGINTIIHDDPRLKLQLPEADLEGTSFASPQPLILDPSLKFPLTSRILTEWTKFGSGSQGYIVTEVVRQPWLICGDGVDNNRIQQVEKAGARVVQVPLDADGRIPPSQLPSILQTLKLRSVMIEGGSRVLSSFLHAPYRENGIPLVNSVIVTVAPMFIGEGVGVVPEDEDKCLPQLITRHTETMGKDAVMICTLAP